MNFLIIVESPSKCKKIENFLGKNYKCIATKGHLREIKGLKSIDKTYNIHFSIIEEKEKHVETMKKIISQYEKSNIYLAMDDDREGESIAWHVCDLFNLSIKETPRIVFHEITSYAIKKALENPLRINMKIVEAQQARQVLDIIVGFKISPYLWKCFFNNKKKALSAGRCQTPALRLIYDNEMEKKSSSLEKKYKTTATFFSEDYVFQLNHFFKNENEVIDFLDISKTYEHHLSVQEKKDFVENPPLPFNTSRLLQVMNNLYHVSPKTTMKLCQELYQDGYITYMRTDSVKYSSYFIEKATQYISKKWNKKYVGETSKITNTNSSLPHEAIRATNLDIVHLDKNTLLNNLYHLIWKNTVQSCMTQFVGNKNSIVISSPQNHQYVHEIETPIFLGWKILQEKKTITDLQEMSASKLLFFHSHKTEIVHYNEIKSEIIVSSNHSYYTESSLVHTLEKLGIGRPSTFSMLVDTIQERGYVKKQDIEGIQMECVNFTLNKTDIQKMIVEKTCNAEKNKLIIQPLGILVIEFLTKYFDGLFSYEYTKNMEEILDKIATEEKIIWHDICEKCKNDIRKYSSNIPTEKVKYKIDENHNILFSSHCPVLMTTNEDNTIEYKNIHLNVDIERLKNGEYMLDDFLENVDKKILGMLDGNEVQLKNGKYGFYAEWKETPENVKRVSLKNINKSFQEINIQDVIDVQNKRTPVVFNKNVLRVIDENTSIRKGKFGAYIYHKTNEMKTPSFHSLNSFKKGFATCDLKELKDWIKKTHHIL